MRFFRPFFFSAILYPEALFRIKTSEKILCLSFDDGPDPDSTPDLLGILHIMNIRALFFCNGSKAEKYPGLVAAIIAEGHIIGNHGFNHLDGWRTQCKEYCSNVSRASQFTSARLFRPPFGRLSPEQYRELKKTFRIYFWDIMPYDFDRTFDAGRSLAVLNRKIRPGSIVVLHDTPASTCRYFLKDFIESSVNKGYRFEQV